MHSFAYPTTLRKGRRWLGPGLCALFALVLGCAKKSRNFDAILDPEGSAGQAGAPGFGGDGSGGTGGSGGSGASGAGGGSGGSGGSGGFVGSGGSGGVGGVSGSGGSGAVGGSGGSGGSGGGGGTGGAQACFTDDPYCECVDDEVVAIDADGDGFGSPDCVEAPGVDCDDSDYGIAGNDCGGCTALGHSVGDPCEDCGEWQCDGDNAMACETPSPAPRRCGNSTTPEVCVTNVWVAQAGCAGNTPACYEGQCEVCVPGAWRCVPGTSSGLGDYEQVQGCSVDSDGGYHWGRGTAGSCYDASNEVCNDATGTCESAWLHPRDTSFEVIPALGVDPSRVGQGRPTEDVLDLAAGFALG